MEKDQSELPVLGNNPRSIVADPALPPTLPPAAPSPLSGIRKKAEKKILPVENSGSKSFINAFLTVIFTIVLAIFLAFTLKNILY